MNTDFLQEWLHSINLRQAELAKLKALITQMDQAPEMREILLKNYTVFLVSNFEGSLKSLTQSYIEDLNSFDLSIISMDIRCHHAAHFTTDSNKGKKLADLFNENRIPIDKKLFPGISIDYNPKESNLKKLFNNLGEKDLIKTLSTDLFDCLFTDNHDEQNQLTSALDEHLTISLGSDLEEYSIFDFKDEGKDTAQFWGNFIQDLMLKRNNIVHGSEAAKGFSHDELEISTLKTFTFIKASCLALLNNHKKSI